VYCPQQQLLASNLSMQIVAIRDGLVIIDDVGHVPAPVQIQELNGLAA
jgi:hypothetical protein